MGRMSFPFSIVTGWIDCVRWPRSVTSESHGGDDDGEDTSRWPSHPVRRRRGAPPRPDADGAAAAGARGHRLPRRRLGAAGPGKGLVRRRTARPEDAGPDRHRGPGQDPPAQPRDAGRDPDRPCHGRYRRAGAAAGGVRLPDQAVQVGRAGGDPQPGRRAPRPGQQGRRPSRPGSRRPRGLPR